MTNESRSTGFLPLLAVIGVSIVFGMLIGGRINAPDVTLAAPSTSPVHLAPAVTGVPGGGANFADVVEAAMPAVVSVRSTRLAGDEAQDEQRGSDPFFRWFFGPDSEPEQRQPSPHTPRPSIGEGSGFIISEDGYVLTNHHVVENADEIEVGLSDGSEFDAEVVGTDPSIDLALLKLNSDEPLPVLPLGDSDAMRVGEWVIAIGNPLDFEQTVTVGVLSAKERRVPIGNTDQGVVSFLQTDAAINFGNSGGPLLDARGNVVGINTAIRRANFAEGIGFALPINHARNVIRQLRENGRVSRGFIGIGMNPNGVDDDAQAWYGLPDKRGVIVDSVTAGGPAADAGLKRGDIIREVDGERVDDNLELIAKIASRMPGEKVRLKVVRKDGGQLRTLEMTAVLGDRDEGLSANLGRRAEPGQPAPPPDDEESSGLGVTVENLSDQIRGMLELPEGQSGVIVTEVEYGSEAADKGIVPRMIVTSINDEPVRDVGDWNERMAGLTPGAPVKVDVLAGTREVSIFLRAPE